MPTSTPNAGNAATQAEMSEFRADEGPLGLLQTDLRKLIYKLLELSILASETTDDTTSQPRCAPKMRVHYAGFVQECFNELHVYV